MVQMRCSLSTGAHQSDVLREKEAHTCRIPSVLRHPCSACHSWGCPQNDLNATRKIERTTIGEICFIEAAEKGILELSNKCKEFCYMIDRAYHSSIRLTYLLFKSPRRSSLSMYVRRRLPAMAHSHEPSKPAMVREKCRKVDLGNGTGARHALANTTEVSADLHAASPALVASRDAVGGAWRLVCSPRPRRKRRLARGRSPVLCETLIRCSPGARSASGTRGLF
jgi:hypothetical protein